MSNINLKYVKKTGPITEEGKFYASLNLFKNGERSKLLDKIMVCDVCPLRTRFGPTGKEYKQCAFWKAGKQSCELKKIKFIEQAKLMVALQKEGALPAMRYVATKQIAASEANELIETMKYGAPGEFSRNWLKDASDSLNNLERAESGRPDSVNNINILSAEKMFGSIEAPKKVEIIETIDVEKEDIEINPDGPDDHPDDIIEVNPDGPDDEPEDYDEL